MTCECHFVTADNFQLCLFEFKVLALASALTEVGASFLDLGAIIMKEVSVLNTVLENLELQFLYSLWDLCV